MRDPEEWIEERRGYPVVMPAGELDLTNVSAFTASLAAAGARGGRCVVVSFERISYFDSSTINCLIEHAKRLAPQGRELVVVAPLSANVLRTLQVIGLHRMFMIFGGVDDALDYAGSPRGAPNPR